MNCCPPQPLVNTSKWAHHAVEYLRHNSQGGQAEWFLSPETSDLPISSWFSGYGCSEIAVEFLNAAKKACCGTSKNTLCSSYQYEINARARSCCARRLDDHACQFIDIMRALDDADRKGLLKLEADPSKTSEDLFAFLVDKEFLQDGLCSKRKFRLGLEKKKIYRRY